MFRAEGVLARNPQDFSHADRRCVEFCLVGADWEEDEKGAAREIVRSLWLVAFGGLAESLIKYAKKGDLIRVEARLRMVPVAGSNSERIEFIVMRLTYGAKRADSPKEGSRQRRSEYEYPLKSDVSEVAGK